MASSSISSPSSGLEPMRPSGHTTSSSSSSLGDIHTVSSTSRHALQNRASSGGHSTDMMDIVPSEGPETKATVRKSNDERARVVGQIMSITAILRPSEDQQEAVKPQNSPIRPEPLAPRPNSVPTTILGRQESLERMMRVAVDQYSKQAGISHLRPIHPSSSVNVVPTRPTLVLPLDQKAQESSIRKPSNFPWRRGSPAIGETSPRRPLLQPRSRTPTHDPLPRRSHRRYTAEERDFIRFHREELKLSWEKVLARFHARWPASRTMRPKSWCMSSVYYQGNRKILLRHRSLSPVPYRLVDSFPERVIAKNYSWMSNEWKQIAYRNLFDRSVEEQKGK